MMDGAALRSAAPDERAAWAARLACAGTAIVASILVALHAIKPELDPSWRFLSEYAIGRNGWVMMLAFLTWAATCAALAFALWREVRTAPGRAGVVVLAVVAVALVVAGVFPQDPVTAKPDELTTNGTLHAMASMAGIPGIPLAAMLISADLWRRNPAWASHRAVLRVSAHATWLSLGVMVIYLAWAVPRAGGFNADVWAGWMNRLVVATYLSWQWVVARRLLANARQPRRVVAHGR